MNRGIKNNNPGNIRHSSVTYLGEKPSEDSAFKAFKTMAYGYRAIFMLLYTYQKRYGLKTIRLMIERYAPPVENDTEKYIANVVAWSGIEADQRIDTLTFNQMLPFVAAISRQEIGMVDKEALQEGWKLFTSKS